MFGKVKAGLFVFDLYTTRSSMRSFLYRPIFAARLDSKKKIGTETALLRQLSSRYDFQSHRVHEKDSRLGRKVELFMCRNKRKT